MNLDGKKSIEQLITLKNYYQEIAIYFEKELKKMPSGSLNYKTKNGFVYPYYYYTTEKGEKKQRYMSKKEKPLIHELSRKRFIKLNLARLREKIKEIEKFVKVFSLYDLDDILSEIPVNFINTDYDVSKNKDCTAWEKEEYDKSKFFPDGLLFGTVGGLRVRSKSEAIIAGLLEINNVPFRYEAALNLGDKTYYPDFTILRPRDKKILYWEHFGMADDEEYSFSMDRKMSVYRKHGIVPWDQLITTFEIERGSMDVRDIQNIVNLFILKTSNDNSMNTKIKINT